MTDKLDQRLNSYTQRVNAQLEQFPCAHEKIIDDIIDDSHIFSDILRPVVDGSGARSIPIARQPLIWFDWFDFASILRLALS